MEENQRLHKQNKHQSPSVEPKAKPVRWHTKITKHLDSWSRPKFSWKQVFWISLTWECLFLISLYCSLLLFGKLYKSKISKEQQYVMDVVFVFLTLVTIAYCIFLWVVLLMPKVCKIWDDILLGIFVFRFLVVLLPFVIFVLVSKAQEHLPSSPAPPAPALCPIPWVGYGERCYYLSAAEANWTHSQSHCASQNGSLVTMETPEEKDFVQRYKQRIGYWIGVRRESLSRPWMRTDESLFNNSFPIRGEGLCAYVNGEKVSSTWCANIRYWICSKQPTERERAKACMPSRDCL